MPYIDEGWLHVGDGTYWHKLACGRIEWDTKKFPEIDEFPGGGVWGYDLGKKGFLLNARNIHIKEAGGVSANDLKEDLELDLDDWAENDGYIQVKVQEKLGANYISLYGSTKTVKCLYFGLGKQSKAPAGQEVMIISTIKFQRSSA